MMSNDEHSVTSDSSLEHAIEQEFAADDAVSGEVSLHPAGMFRRVAALVYDSLIVVAVLMVATVPFLPFIGNRVLVAQEVGALAHLYHLWELLIIALFFGFFWTRRGQTLGMQAWRLRVEQSTGELLSWPRALLREALALLPWLPGFLVLSYAVSAHSVVQALGLGLLSLGLADWISMWFDPFRRTWHDRRADTRVVVLAKGNSTRSDW